MANFEQRIKGAGSRLEPQASKIELLPWS